jgi:hypothetical protein
MLGGLVVVAAAFWIYSGTHFPPFGGGVERPKAS